MSKQEQVLQIEPQNELKFRGEKTNCDIDVFFPTYIYPIKWYMLKVSKLSTNIKFP